MRWTLLAVLVLLSGCADEAADGAARSGTGTDQSLPGVVVSGNATFDDGQWLVQAEGRNEGSRTYRVDTFCQSPLGLEAYAEGGEPFSEVQCLAYAQPVPFRPGDVVTRSWTVDAEELHWSGDVTFVVHFSDAEGVGDIRVELTRSSRL